MGNFEGHPEFTDLPQSTQSLPPLPVVAILGPGRQSYDWEHKYHSRFLAYLELIEDVDGSSSRFVSLTSRVPELDELHMKYRISLN